MFTGDIVKVETFEILKKLFLKTHISLKILFELTIINNLQIINALSSDKLLQHKNIKTTKQS